MSDAAKKTNELARQRYIIDLQRLLYKAEWRLEMAYKALSETGVSNPKDVVEELLREDYRKLMEGMDNKKKRVKMNTEMQNFSKQVDKRVENYESE